MQTWTSIGAVAAVVVAALATPASAGGTHRDCRYSEWQGFHRHVGSYNRAVSCDEEIQHRRTSRHRPWGQRRLHVEVPLGYRTHSYSGYGGNSSSCVRDWHCERTGLFGLDKYCYWRQVCD
ncbi:MAG: hypothetical protein R3D57_16910 [Hyphomicrobiaceae bacterium]